MARPIKHRGKWRIAERAGDVGTVFKIDTDGTGYGIGAFTLVDGTIYGTSAVGGRLSIAGALASTEGLVTHLRGA